MKKLLPIVVAVLILGGGAAAYIASKKDKSSTTANSSNPAPASQPAAASTKYTGKKACDVFRLEDAKKVLGESAKAGDSNNDKPTESEALTVSTCTYSDGTGALGQSKSATLLVRAAKNDTGAASNKAAFGSQKPAGAQDVSGYGETAFWNPAFGQLNILKNHNWYILSNGPLKATDKTVDQAKQLADLVSPKL